MKEQKIDKIRHSLAHIMATAVLEKHPNAKLGIGPVIENGFYYDFDFNSPISEKEFGNIEKRIRKIIKKDIKFKKKFVTYSEAKKIFKGNPYKLELIEELNKDKKKISIYESGNFIDLCSGPHIKSTSEINPDAFKITHLAGAYWKGNEKNKQLTRIYAVAFETKKELGKYLQMREEAEKRDHLKLGKDLELFTINEEVGQGLPLWLPNGAIIKYHVEKYILEKYMKYGYVPISTPHIGNEELFKTSGHLQNYNESMYSPIEIDDEKYYLKPMNCPFHLMIYKNSQKSYRDLPIRYTELGTVYRYERSGTLRGLTRVRGFTQDDGHIICTPEQLEGEILKALKLTKEVLQTLGFKEFRVALSVRGKKNKKDYLGKDKDWEKAKKALAKGLEKMKLEYKTEEGEAAFYGPKIDVKVKDAIGREWQISTLQLDFNLPERFDMVYIDEKGKKVRPFMLHRALLGSIERFIGLLIENYAGNFPTWLSPKQVAILPISEKQLSYAEKINKMLQENDIRSEVFGENQTLGKKIREAETKKIPYILVVGDKEKKSLSVNVRNHKKQTNKSMKIERFVKDIKEEIEKRK